MPTLRKSTFDPCTVHNERTWSDKLTMATLLALFEPVVFGQHVVVIAAVVVLL